MTIPSYFRTTHVFLEGFSGLGGCVSAKVVIGSWLLWRTGQNRHGASPDSDSGSEPRLWISRRPPRPRPRVTARAKKCQRAQECNKSTRRLFEEVLISERVFNSRTFGLGDCSNCWARASWGIQERLGHGGRRRDDGDGYTSVSALTWVIPDSANPRPSAGRPQASSDSPTRANQGNAHVKNLFHVLYK